MAEMVFPAHPLMGDLAREPLVVDGAGEIDLGERPGLGIELDPDAVKRYRVG
jgi:L-alanine-DL-glutamate epimerase-like enolase superfamily enzyme